MANKKEISSKMYSNHRCGKCNRFGHSHEKCEKGLKDFNPKNPMDKVEYMAKMRKMMSGPNYHE